MVPQRASSSTPRALPFPIRRKKHESPLARPPRMCVVPGSRSPRRNLLPRDRELRFCARNGGGPGAAAGIGDSLVVAVVPHIAACGLPIIVTQFPGRIAGAGALAKCPREVVLTLAGCQRPGRVLSRAALHCAVWTGAFSLVSLSFCGSIPGVFFTEEWCFLDYGFRWNCHEKNQIEPHKN